MRLHRSTAAVAASVVTLAAGGGVAWACTGTGDPGYPGTTGTTGTTTTTTTTATTASALRHAARAGHHKHDARKSARHG